MKKKTLRFQIYAAIFTTFLIVTVIYGLILYPFENQRRKTVIDKIELSLKAIVEQREDELANEIFLNHGEAISLILQKMLQSEGIVAISVYDQNGQLISSTDKTAPVTLSASESEALSQTYSFAEDTWSRQPVLTYAKQILVIGENVGYLKIHYTLVDVIRETRIAIVIFTALLLTILVSISLLLNVFLRRFITYPVGVLIEAMRKVQRGHLGVQVDLRSENEIGEMSQTFNQMSSENARMYAELQELSKNLEVKVEERTKELTQAQEATLRAMKDLERTKAYIENILANFLDTLIVTDTDGVIETVNHVVLELLGYREEELVGKHLSVISGKKVLSKKVLKEEKIWNLEVRYKTKDNRSIPMLLSGALMRDKNGDSIGILYVAKDITERKQAEEQLQREKQAVQRLAEERETVAKIGRIIGSTLEIDKVYEQFAAEVKKVIPFDRIAIIIIYHERGTYGTTYITGKDILGYRPGDVAPLAGSLTGEIVRKRSGQLVWMEDRAEVAGRFPGLLAEFEVGLRSCMAVPLISKDEIIAVLHVQSVKQKAYTEADVGLAESIGSQIAGAIANAQLYAERKRAEQQLQRYAVELEKSNEEVKNFAYIVSHDLRSPLVNLKGFANELRSAVREASTVMDAVLSHLDEGQQRVLSASLHEDIPESLGFIESSVDRMESFIDAVLVLSRLGRRELKMEPLDMNILVGTTVRTLASQIEQGGVQVTMAPLPAVTADRTSMEQVMGNILGNAVKYLEPGRLGRIEISAERNHQETVFSIRDNGRGIAAEDMDKVFAPFRRAGRQDTPGEGMGLAYVQTLVRRHGGRIWCESALGTGTSFVFTIPDRQGEGG